jgi:GNAT superfamily N-acetyltransferase
MPDLKFREVDQTNWADFVKFFEGKGCPSYCWCMAWRPLPGDRAKASNTVRKNSMKRIVNAGTPVGILAYDGQSPVGWCSIAPRSSYTPLGGEEYEGAPDHKVWSLVCFFVPRARRGEGIGKQLLAAAIKAARKHGARIVEAYPVDPDSPSYRFMGFVANFAQAGFTETKRAGKRRHVMHLRLR